MATTWLIPDKPEIASYRYRCLIPRKHLPEYPVTVVAKDWIPWDELPRGPLIWDCCDDHFRTHDYYKRIADRADAIVVPTQNMKDRVKAETGKEAFIVEDPYEFPEKEPRLPSGKAQNLFWYGHKSNLQGLLDRRPSFTGRQIRVISNWPGCRPWSHEGMLEWFEWCDVVPIPVQQTDKAQAKSPNRMVEAIRQGRYVVAEPLPSYQPYGMWSGDLKEGLEWVDTHPEEALEAVRNAQRIVREKHSPEVIAQQWIKVFNHVTCDVLRP